MREFIECNSSFLSSVAVGIPVGLVLIVISAKFRALGRWIDRPSLTRGVVIALLSLTQIDSAASYFSRQCSHFSAWGSLALFAWLMLIAISEIKSWRLSRRVYA